MVATGLATAAVTKVAKPIVSRSRILLLRSDAYVRQLFKICTPYDRCWAIETGKLA